MVQLTHRASLLVLPLLVVPCAIAQEPEGPPPPGSRGGRSPGGMTRMFPIMQALDTNEDGELSAEEIANASAALATLDKDGDGSLASDELAPDFGSFGGRGGGRGGNRGGGRRGGFGVERSGPPLAPEELDPKDGTATIPDRETFERLSYQGSMVMIDTHLIGLEYVKFQIEGYGTDDPKIYFMNTETHRGHPMFMSAIGLPRGGTGQMRGVLVFRPMIDSPEGPGVYTFEFEPNDAYPFEMIQGALELLESHSELMKGRLAYYLLPRAKERYLSEAAKYEAAGLPVYDEGDLYEDIGFLPLHLAESFGRLRVMSQGERPSPRDVVLYPTLPNEMPRVAGIITGVRQTPLSHVNLRAIQDDVPNAFIADYERDAAIVDLIGKYVYYAVEADGYEIREATVDEVEEHFAAMRPASPQSPPRDLTVTEIRAFGDVGFDAADAFGVKSANLATLRTFGLRDDLVPDGYAVPFHFYDAFMKHNGFYKAAQATIAMPGFDADAETRAAALKRLQKDIEDGEMPTWMMDALADVQASFPEGTSIRCRSSTNNEDLPGYSGAGLYDSFTHRLDEGHLSKSIKQVYASLWNYRAFEEREFHRIDHFASAMGVALHPNTSDEEANGVAVTDDIVYQTGEQTGRSYYVNAQVGEDRVTNPDDGSIPEEILLDPKTAGRDRVMQRSNRVPGRGLLLSARHLNELREALGVIHGGFAKLYDRPAGEAFSMEVEFKVTVDGKLLIKQARPWVY